MVSTGLIQDWATSKGMSELLAGSATAPRKKCLTRNLESGWTGYMQTGRRERVWHSKSWLYRQYVVKKMTEQEIADLAKTNQSTINRWLRKFELKK